MNRGLTDRFVSSFREDAPRPPVPGEEGEASRRSPGKLAAIRPPSKTKPAVVEPPVSTRRNEDGLGAPEGSAAPDSPLVRWTKSLHSLLGDQDGAHLFRVFLDRQKRADALDFWFACNGFRQMKPKDGKTLRVARAIYKRYIENAGVVSGQLKAATKVYIRETIKRQQIDSAMFDQAQTEIQSTMEEDAYQMFLTSDIYLEYVRTGCESPAGALKLMCGYLSRLKEEDEWTGSDFKAMELASLVGLPTKETRPPAVFSSADQYRLYQFTNPPKTCHVNGGHMFAPASSAHDSEASSDALTDDSMSMTDSSVDGAPPCKLGSRKLLKREMDLSVKANGCVALPSFPKTQRPPGDLGPVEPAAFAAQLITRLERLRREQETRSSLEQRLQQIREEEERDEVEVPGGGPCDDDPQAILDEHLSRVLRTPGCQSPGAGVGVACRCLSPDRCAPRRASWLTVTQQQTGPRGHGVAGEGVEGTRCRGAALGSLTSVQCGQCNAVPRRLCQAGEGGTVGTCEWEAPQPPSDGADRSQSVWQWILDSERQGRHRSHGQRAKKLHTGDPPPLRGAGGGGNPRLAQPSQPFVQDPSMPPLPPPNTLSQLEEARRRLEEASMQRCAVSSPALERSRAAPLMNRRTLLSSPGTRAEECRDPQGTLGPELIVTYFFCGEDIPYRRMVRSHSLTLGHFKEQLRKKGDYRYYFKKASDEFECGAVFEEVWEDGAVLPMYEGKILGKVERMD